MVMKPAWLQGLMAETFFGACEVHENCRKNDKNIFCLNCCRSFCPHCLPSHHPSHPMLQVRRYVYQDVIRLDDLEKLIDCSYIQPYTINSAKVIFLNQRMQSSSSCKAGTGNTCLTCDRILQDPFSFCSLSCKVDHMVHQGEDLSSILYRFDREEDSDFPISRVQFEGLRADASDDAQITPNSIFLEDHDDRLEYGINNANFEGRDSGLMRRINPKEKGGFQLHAAAAGIMLSLSSRRKGAPHRSPLS
ncbi:hypothetical protein CDL12_13668 [Handroanthus impetiginosus]|uniref:B box-type domain-containing protein n=1 Tax=Handroanthus impetiginosus TaxID=429701 RepID=A0A2G9H868_9LAMI|nr:hypothetical protein CDL12_27246 [Handroanthus impetiginosus]PIN13717.1 hypothetical protein CDL12_13668 [Handroanthus impetiginosus]